MLIDTMTVRQFFDMLDRICSRYDCKRSCPLFDLCPLESFTRGLDLVNEMAERLKSEDVALRYRIVDDSDGYKFYPVEEGE